MIRHAKLNAKLYAEMVELGYSDESFPVWWYSPGREGTGVKVVGQGGTTEEGGGQIGGRSTELEGGEDFAPTPPDTPVPKEGRPALPEPPVLSSPVLSSPVLSKDVQPSPTSSKFSDAELSLLKDRAVTEIMPGQWMHTQEQADGRIIARGSFHETLIVYGCARGVCSTFYLASFVVLGGLGQSRFPCRIARVREFLSPRGSYLLLH